MMVDSKVCCRCKLSKPVHAFAMAELRGGKRYRRSWCRECETAYHVAYRKAKRKAG